MDDIIDGEIVSEIDAPFPSNRGFMQFDSVLTTYGHRVRVYESSAADAPHLWLDIGASTVVDGHTAHMTIGQARQVREQLDWMIDYLEKSWDV